MIREALNPPKTLMLVVEICLALGVGENVLVPYILEPPVLWASNTYLPTFMHYT